MKNVQKFFILLNTTGFYKEMNHEDIQAENKCNKNEF